MTVKIKDPICGMIVDEPKSRHQASYSGAEYYFCSDACLHKFQEHPERFVGTTRPA
jgi:Cu+-exporting ATPase